MLSKKHLMILAPVLLVAIAAGAFFGLGIGKSQPVNEKKLMKQAGPVYTLTEPFVINLSDSGQTRRYAKVGVALQVSKFSAKKVPAVEPGVTATAIEQEPKLRDIIISTLQDHSAANLSTTAGRTEVKTTIVDRVNKETELRILDVYYTEFAVQ
jgi:flagellar protein FliL